MSQGVIVNNDEEGGCYRGIDDEDALSDLEGEAEDLEGEAEEENDEEEDE